MSRKSKFYQRPDGLYEASRVINGKRKVFRGRTCAEVERKMLAYKDEAANGRKFPVIAEEWLAAREREVSLSTYKNYDIAVRRACEEFTGPVGKITALQIQRYVHSVEAMGYAAGTVSLELGVIKQILSHAVLAGDIPVNPAAEVRRSKGLPKTVRHALTEEQEHLVESCRAGDWWWLGLMFLYTGCRRGELLALEWKDIDRRAGVVRINKKLNYVNPANPVLENHTKSKNGIRDIPLFDVLADALPRDRIGRIFTGKNGYMTGSEFDAVWKQYCRDSGLADEKGKPSVTPHQFRHSFATICFEAGIDSKAAAAFLGDTEDVTTGIYMELRKSHHITCADQVNAFLAMRSASRQSG